MKKLWKHEWKYHLFFVILVVFVLVMQFHDYLWESGYHIYSEPIDMQADAISEMICIRIWLVDEMAVRFLKMIVPVVLAVILIKKGFIYSVEKNVCGRDYFQSLPIRKNERFCFHLLMDVLSVVIAMIAIGIYEPMVLQNLISQNGIEIPWLFTSYFTMMVVNISYALIVLGVLYVVESFFVNGPMKLVGICGVGFTLTYEINCLYEKYDSIPFVEAAYKFLSRKLPVEDYYREGYDLEMHGIFSEPGKNVYHIWYVVGYLLIALLLIGIANYLNNRQEASKEGFYFGFAKYVVSGFISSAFLMLLMRNRVSGWHQVLCVMSCIMVFVLLVWLFDTDKSKDILHRKRGVKDNK